MRKATSVLVALALAVAIVPSSSAAAPNPICTAANIDPFGSCELTSDLRGVTRCGLEGTPVEGRATLLNPAVGDGLQICADKENSSASLWGRIGIYRDPAGVVTIFADGDDVRNEVLTASWVRVDLRPDAPECRVYARNGSAGSYWNTRAGTSDATLDTVGSYEGSSEPDVVNACV